jgi:hypothetical protein
MLAPRIRCHEELDARGIKVGRQFFAIDVKTVNFTSGFYGVLYV